MFISQLPKLLGWTSNIFSREVKKTGDTNRKYVYSFEF